jgi:hypothetical protein
LETQVVSALRKLAADLDIQGRSRLRKAALIDAILLAMSEESTSDEDPMADGSAADESAVDESAVDESAVDVSTATESAAEEADLIAAAAEPDEGASLDAADAEAIEAAGEAALEAADADLEAAAVESGGAEGAPAEAEEAPTPLVEPSAGDVFIDRGEPIPDAYPGERMRVLVRDPGSLYVYWETGQDRRWSVAAEAGGEVLHTFQTDSAHAGGYLHAPADRVQKVVVTSPAAPRFEARLAAPEPPAPAPAFPPAQPERWAQFSPPEEAPAGIGAGAPSAGGLPAGAPVAPVPPRPPLGGAPAEQRTAEAAPRSSSGSSPGSSSGSSSDYTAPASFSPADLAPPTSGAPR